MNLQKVVALPALLSMLASPAQVAGQSSLYISAGASTVSTDRLDERLADVGYPQFGQTALSIGLGISRSLPGHVRIGAEWNGLLIGKDFVEGQETGLAGGYATVSLGYDLPIDESLRLRPKAGVGLGGMGLWIDRPDNDSPIGFEELLENPQSNDYGQTTLSLAEAVLDVGIAGELFGDGPGRVPVLGFRAGYLFAPLSFAWSFGGREITGAPDASTAGFYLRMTVGLGRLG